MTFILFVSVSKVIVGKGLRRVLTGSVPPLPISYHLIILYRHYCLHHNLQQYHTYHDTTSPDIMQTHKTRVNIIKIRLFNKT